MMVASGWRYAAWVVPLSLSVLAAPCTSAAQRVEPRQIDVVEATIAELQAAMRNGAVTAVELVDAYLDRIDAFDQRGPVLNAMIVLNPHARAEAAALDRERTERGERGPLHGIPVILKDNFDAAGLPTTAGSVALAGLVPPDDGFQVRKLREAGAIILGKANMHELASGITTISSLGGQTRNPYDPTRNPGGSSGGTGAAIAASFAAIGWGTDTCGSIRIPAAQNNLFGLRPTKGLSSIDGIVPLCHTQDVAGPLARTAIDLAIALDATVGRDVADAATAVLDTVPVPRFVAALDTNALRGARLGVLQSFVGDASDDDEIVSVIRAAVDQMRAWGAEVIDIEVPGLDSGLVGSSVIDFEFKFDLMDYLSATPGASVSSLDEILSRGLFHEALESRLQRRNRVEARDSPGYRAAMAKRGPVRDSVVAVMDRLRLDAVVYPTMRVKPAILGEPQTGSNCQLSATSGLPALSVPIGFTADGLPVGLELLGRPFDDARLVSIGYAFEQRAQPRRVPPTTPRLVEGKTPGEVLFTVAIGDAANDASPRALGEFRFNPFLGRLHYAVRVFGVQSSDVYAITIGRSDGAVIHRLSGPGVATASGTVRLSHRARQDLAQGLLALTIYAASTPQGSISRTLVLPAPDSGM